MASAPGPSLPWLPLHPHLALSIHGLQSSWASFRVQLATTQQKVVSLAFTETVFLIVLVAKFLLKIDDALDLFAEHAIGGVIGLLFNGFFASHTIIALDGVNVNVNGGWIDHNWKQLYIQFAYVCATCAYTFVVTAIIAKAVDMIPGLHLKTTPEGESLGLDEVEVSIFRPLTIS